MFWLQNYVLNIFYILIEFLWFHPQVKHFVLLSLTSSFFSDNLKIHLKIYRKWLMKISDIYDFACSLMLISFENSNSASLLKPQMLSYAKLLDKMLMDTTSSDLNEHYFHQENPLYLSEYAIYGNLVLLNWIFFFRIKFCDFNLWDFCFPSYRCTSRKSMTKRIKWSVIFCCVVTSFSRYAIFFVNTFRIFYLVRQWRKPIQLENFNVKAPVKKDVTLFTM